MEELVDADPEKLRAFFEDNRPHYQSPLRFKVRLWDLPFDDDPPQQLAQMEKLRDALAAGNARVQKAQQDLYRQVAESRFTAAGFVFYEDAARRLVTEPAAELSPESS